MKVGHVWAGKFISREVRLRVPNVKNKSKWTHIDTAALSLLTSQRAQRSADHQSQVSPSDNHEYLHKVSC